MLSGAFGPSGNEEEIRAVIQKEIEGCGEIFTDTLGNLICHIKGEGPKLLFAAHMDEIGLVVTFIEEDGFLRFAPIGGVRAHTILHSRVLLEGGARGIVSLGEKKEAKDAKISDMFIDIGAKDRAHAMETVDIGHSGVFEGAFSEIGCFVSAKALDNRVGCAVLIDTIRRVKKSPNDLYFVFTVQEEVGLRGAAPAAFAIEPDYAIAVDITSCAGVPDGHRLPQKSGKGPAIKIKDARTITHPKVKELLIKAANAADVQFQYEILEVGGTDAGAFASVKAGIASGALSIPLKYVHSPCEMVHMEDVVNTAKILLAVASMGIEE